MSRGGWTSASLPRSSATSRRRGRCCCEPSTPGWTKPAPGRPDALVLASAGSGSARARAAAEGIARDLGAARGVPAVAAFASAAAPSPADALRSLRGRGARSPAVASLFVAPGRLPDSVAAAAGDVPVAAPLSTATAFVELLLLRAAEPAIAR